MDLARHYPISEDDAIRDYDYFPLSDSVIRAVIAVAEYAEDPFRLGCLMLLADLRTSPNAFRSPSSAS